MKNFQWKSLLPHLIAVVIFALVATIYCKPALEGKVLQQSDVIHWKGMAQDLFKYKETHGHFPLWNNNLFGGMPAYQVAMESSNPLSPGIFHSLFTLNLPKPISFFFLLCISFYFLSQVLKVNPWIGIIGSIGYAYATYCPIIASVGHETKILAMGYMPALLGAIWLIYHRKYLWGGALTALFTFLLISQNHLQITYYFLMVAGFMTIGFIVECIRNKAYKHLIIAGTIAVITGSLGAACNLVTLSTTNDYSKATMRNGTLNLDTTTNANKKSSGLPIDYAFNWSYGKVETFTLIFPGIYGGSSGSNIEGNGEIGANSHLAKLLIDKNVPEDQATQFAAQMPAYWGAQPSTSGPVYLGAIICLLFVFAMVYLETPDKWWMLAVCIFAILLSWGKNFMDFNAFMFDHFPLYNKFRAPSMILVIPQLIFPIAGILALQKFFFEETDKENALKKLKTTSYIIGGILVIGILFYVSADYSASSDESIKNYFKQMTQGNDNEAHSLYSALKADRQSLFGTDLLRAIVFITATLALLWLVIKDKVKAIYAIAAIALLCSIDLLSVGRRYLNDNNFQDESTLADNYFKPTAADQQILKDTSYFRVLNLSQDVFNDALTSYFHHSVGGYHPAKMSIVEDLLNFHLRKQPMNIKVLDMLNTKYIITSSPQSKEPVAELNPNALGPCWFVKGIEFEKMPAGVMKALNTFNPKDTAVVDEQYKETLSGIAVDTAAKILLVKNDNDFIEYKSNSTANQFAVFSEIFYDRGWKAYIDGKESPIIQTNYVLRGLLVPSGEHKITFEFKPASYYQSKNLAIVASGFVWLLLLFAVADPFIKRKKGND